MDFNLPRKKWQLPYQILSKTLKQQQTKNNKKQQQTKNNTNKQKTQTNKKHKQTKHTNKQNTQTNKKQHKQTKNTTTYFLTKIPVRQFGCFVSFCTSFHSKKFLLHMPTLQTFTTIT
jgi:DNA replication protein DnaC